MFKKFPELIENAETISYIGKIENIEEDWELCRLRSGCSIT